jgi:alkanesulfonate monooxygenase SsuD/methylene tetrahydromethanopterin reductase-like flavin-dependent oxidoreductase (luciferase family)
MSGGRFELGVGTGWMELEHEAFGIALPPMGQRYARFEEALRYLWAAFGRTEGGFDGEHYGLTDIAVLPRVGDGTPIIIGGSGEKRTPTLAGRYADEYNVFTMAKRPLDARLAVLRDAARGAGRDPDAIKISMAVNPILAADATEHRAILAELAAARELDVDQYVAILDERHIPHGTDDRVASQLAEIASWGVGRVYLQQFTALDEIDTGRVGDAARLIRGL